MGGKIRLEDAPRVRFGALAGFEQDTRLFCPYNGLVDPLMLATKIHLPPLNPKRIPRAALLSRLRAGIDGRLILLSAPPGFGKTTLVRDWIADLDPEWAIAWFSLDEEDNDPARFWRYLTAAIDRALPAPPGADARLRPDRPTPPSKVVVASLINRLASNPRRLLLVLDDYHAIQTPEIHEALAFLVNNQPPNFLLALTSREDPPLPLSRFRARGLLVEIRAADLRFDDAATDAFLNGVMQIGLPPEDIRVLASRTEGWVAGLQLAGLSMQSHSDRQGFVSAFTGSHRYVFDYLVEEVLSRQTPELQRFLLETSVLERLEGSLCDAVTGRKNGQATLEALEQANLMLVSLDGDRRWYRYHHLFADVLRLMLKRTTPEQVATLHLRASSWFERAGLISEAVVHALKAEDYGRVSRLVWLAEGLWRRGETRKLRHWLSVLPDEILQEQPRLLLLHAWALMPTGRFEELEALRDQAEDAYRKLPDPVLRAPLTALKAYLARWREAIPEAITLAQEALDLLPEADWMWRGLTELTLAAATRYAGDLKLACRTYQALATRSQHEEPFFAIAATCMHASVLLEAGQLRAALARYQGALDLAARHDGRNWGVSGMALVGIGEILREKRMDREAEAFLEEGLACGEGLPQVTVYGAISLARLHAAYGNQAAAKRALAQGQTAAERTGTKQAHDAMMAGMASVWELLDDSQRLALSAWSMTLDHEVPEGPLSEVRRLQLVAKARIMLHEGALQDAELLLAALSCQASRAGRHGVALEAMVLHAHVLDQLERSDEATRVYTRAREIADPEGYRQIFMEASFKFLSAVPEGRVTNPPAAPLPGRALPERLSDREIEVLRLLAAGASNQRIADLLSVSLATAKKHCSNILGKLGVANRTEAAAKARDLGLID